MIRIVVPGPPPRKNARGTIAMVRGRARRVTPKRTRDWVAALDAAWRISLDRRVPERLAKSGRWSVSITTWEEKLRHLDVSVPLGDVDSVISIVLDGLQKIGLLDDDARVIEVMARKRYSLGTPPRVEIEMWQDAP